MPKTAALRPPRPGANGPTSAPSPAPASAPPPHRTTASVSVRTRPRPGRLGPLRLPQLVVAEVAAALVLIGLAVDRIALIACGTVAVLLAAVTLPRLRGLSPVEWLLLRGAARRRRRYSAAHPVDPETDPALVPVLECEPALRTFPHTLEADGGRSPAAGPTGPSALAPARAQVRAGARGERREIGMIGDGTFLTAIIRVEPADTPLRPARGLGMLPLELLADGLVVDDIVLDAVQVVQYAQPAPAPHLPEQSLAARGYRELPQGAATPALRLTWVTVRLDPELCRSAVAARGGGEEGARKALQRAADQLASRLTGAGLRATVLDSAGALAAVSTATCANPLAAGSAARPGRRTSESARSWRCDDRWHTSYWISQWPRLAAGPGGPGLAAADLVGRLLASGALGTTVSLTMRQALGDAFSLTGMVRITVRGESELERTAKQLESQARGAGATLVRLEHEQVPGLLATLPLGGTR
jgi:type VII secretion protein EccE